MKKTNIDIREGGLDYLGSGSADFQAYLLENRTEHAGLNFGDRFYRYVVSGRHASVGGKPQMLLSTESETTVAPLLIGEDDGSNASLFLSGYNVDGYKVVGPFGVGHTLQGINMTECTWATALKNARITESRDTLDASLSNQVMMQYQIKAQSEHFQ